MKILFPPPYSPQLNPVERLWKEIREKSFANLVFDSIDAVEHRLMDALIFMNQPLDLVKDFFAFNWMITNLKKANQYKSSALSRHPGVFPESSFCQI